MKTTHIAILLLATGLALVGTAGTALADDCNGIYDYGGCTYKVGNIEYVCKLWVTVAGCVDGSSDTAI